MKRVSLVRQLRVNHRRHGNHLERCDWWFLIIDKKEQIRQIQERIYALFHISKEDYKLNGRVRGSGVNYLRINFESEERVDLESLIPFSGKVVADIHLYCGRDKEGLERYISEMV